MVLLYITHARKWEKKPAQTRVVRQQQHGLTERLVEESIRGRKKKRRLLTKRIRPKRGVHGKQLTRMGGGKVKKTSQERTGLFSYTRR